MSRISTSSSGGNVNIQDTEGNPLSATNGALNTIPQGFGSLTEGSPNQIAVGLTSAQLFAANPNRKYAHIVNNSGQHIFIQYAASAALNQGVRIPPNGFYTIESNNLWLGAINAIGVTTNQLIDILEGE